MKIYKVGGCVRDYLMGKEPKDIDYVVVGSNEQEMLSLGFEQVGQDFPVFLHPKDKSEYALARKEKKIGHGYNGFSTETKNVSLEEDLYRRDLTINAIAMDNNENIIDPFNGSDDIKNKILRHVSEHFKEDPVRILRVARFSARYNFKVSKETYQLMSIMVKNGEFDCLTKERVWLEFEKSLTEPFLKNFFDILEHIGALEKIFNFSNLKDKDFLNLNHGFLTNLLHIFSHCSQDELNEWKIPEKEKTYIRVYTDFLNQGKFYSELNNKEKLNFIKSTKALHHSDMAINIIHSYNLYQSYLNILSDFRHEKNTLIRDLQKLKSLDYLKISKDNKHNIKNAIENAQLNIISKNSLDKNRYKP